MLNRSIGDLPKKTLRDDWLASLPVIQANRMMRARICEMIATPVATVIAAAG
jgi:hypothetical protein